MSSVWSCSSWSASLNPPRCFPAWGYGLSVPSCSKTRFKGLHRFLNHQRGPARTRTAREFEEETSVLAFMRVDRPSVVTGSQSHSAAGSFPSFAPSQLRADQAGLLVLLLD